MPGSRRGVEAASLNGAGAPFGAFSFFFFFTSRLPLSRDFAMVPCLPDLVRRAAIVPSITRSVHALVTLRGAVDQDLEAGAPPLPQRPQIVAAFQGPARPPSPVLDRPRLDQLGELAVAPGRDLEAGHRVIRVGVEAGRYQQQFSTERRECRAALLFPGTEKHRVSGTAGERDVDDIAVRPALAGTSGPWIERKLMGRRVEDLGVVFETVLRAVAVVDVEVEHPDAPNAHGARRDQTDGDVVEETEAHRLRVLGMMARRPNDRDGVTDLSVQ